MVTVTADDGNGGTDSADVTVTVTEPEPNPLVVEAWTTGDALYRVNAGGPQLPAADGGAPWAADQVAANAGGTATTGPESPLLDPAYAAQPDGEKNAHGTADAITLDASVPAGVPAELFQVERWDAPSGLELGYDFDVPAGDVVEVRVYLAEIFQTGTPATPRVFDVQVDGATVAHDVAPLADHGHDVGHVLAFPVESDGTIDLDFLHETENPAVKGVEVVELVDAATVPAGGGAVFVSTVTNPASNGQSVSIDDVVHTLAGPGGPVDASVADSCDPVVPTDLAPGDVATCRHVTAVDGDADDVVTGSISVSGTFAQGGDAAATSGDVTLTLAGSSPVVARINAGGPTIDAADGGPAWEADTTASNHPHLAVAGTNDTGAFPVTGRHASVPAHAPQELFATERYDTGPGAPDMTWQVPVEPGATVDVLLYMGNGYGGTSAPGSRLFDVAIEGATVLEEFDLSATFGHQVGGTEAFPVTDDGDGLVTITYRHGSIENPLVNAIEVRSD